MGAARAALLQHHRAGRNRPAEWLDVTKDVGEVSPDDYDAVIVAANYTSVRLRWSEREDVTAANAAEVVRGVPAVRFFRQAMRNPDVIKGAACHGLWLLTTSPTDCIYAERAF